jgi:uncharacterized phage protein gp47/JayE
MFQTKTFNSIVASMINRVTAANSTLTDFNTGSVLRTLIEAIAAEIDEYYQVLLKGFYEAVPVAIYKTFSFGRLTAESASGYVTFTRESGITGDITIPAGTRVSTTNGEVEYIVPNSYIIASGSNTVEALITAEEAGASGNCAASGVDTLVSSVYGIASVANSAAIAGGRDEETDAERKLRFQQWLVTLARSTKEAIEYGAKSAVLTDALGNVTEQVTQVLIHEPCVDGSDVVCPGYIDVHIWNGVNGASAYLQAEVHKILYGYTDTSGAKVPGWKAAGVIATIYEVVGESTNVTAVITLDGTRTDVDVNADVELVIGEVFGALKIGESLIWAKLLHAILEVEGIADISLFDPEANVDPSDGFRILVPGAVSLWYI